MKYYNTESQTVVSERQVVKANPNTSFALPFSDATRHWPLSTWSD